MDMAQEDRKPKLLFLTGMPGAGKTWWGQRIAREFGWRFTDLDEYMEQREAATIAQLFETHGEEGFRAIEHESLQQLIGTTASNTVIACGGGTPCFSGNLVLMKEAGVVAYLRAPIPLLISRLTAGATVRPLLSGAKEDITTVLEQMLMKREPWYRQAHHILDADLISLATFGQIIG
jgi:shikimate kinase